MRRKILIHSIVFSPDGVSTAYLYNDIALKFAENNYEVVVLTTTPHYNIIDSEISKQPMKKRLLGLFYESCFNGIKVLHVPQKKYNNTILRILGFIHWHLLSFVLGLLEKRISLILSPSPPLTIGLVSLFIARLKGAKVIYNVQEIYPDFLINQGKLKSKLIINLLKKLEHFVYNKSDAVTTIDSMFYNCIVDRFDDKSKLSIIPNFVDTDIYKPISAQNSLIKLKEFPNSNKLKIMYAGNIGFAQDWDPLIEIAKNCINFPVEFWVIGEGVQRKYLEKEVKRNNLSNVNLIDYQPRELIPSIISYADLHFIFMTPEMENEGFPSKVYSILACKKPLLIISGKKTPLNNFLKGTNSAFIIESKSLKSKVEEATQVIKDLLQDRKVLKKMEQKAFDLIQYHYSKDVVTGRYIDLIESIL